MSDVPDEVQRWTAKRKAAVVMSIVKGETLAAEATRKHGLTVAEVERWQEQFFAAGENALRARPRDEYVLVLVGGDPPPARAADKRCVFLGKLDQKPLSEVYRACDLFVLPSEAEGFPLTVQEAMASGLPIVTTDDPGYGVCGLDRDGVLLIEPTVPAIKGALTRLAGDPRRRKAMARYSSKFARRNFGREQHIERLRSLHEEALSAWDAKATSSHAVVGKTGGSRRAGR